MPPKQSYIDFIPPRDREMEDMCHMIKGCLGICMYTPTYSHVDYNWLQLFRQRIVHDRLRNHNPNRCAPRFSMKGNSHWKWMVNMGDDGPGKWMVGDCSSEHGQLRAVVYNTSLGTLCLCILSSIMLGLRPDNFTGNNDTVEKRRKYKSSCIEL